MDSQESLKRFRAIAKRLTNMGITIVPTYPGERRALFNRWQTEATTDMATVEKWMTDGYILTDKETNQDYAHVVDEDHNWVCVAKEDGVGCCEIDDYEACLRRGFPPFADDVFTVDTPSGGLHVPFVQDERTRKLGNRNVVIKDVENRDFKILEFKSHNAPWCGPWQLRADGGYYKPHNGKAPLAVLSDEQIAWIDANAKSKPKEPSIKKPFKGFHPTHDQEVFLEHFDTTEHDHGTLDGAYVVVPESCPKCGKEAKDTTIPGAVSKFFFNESYWDYYCNACGAKRADLEEEYGEHEFMVFEDEDDELVLAKFGAVDADECTPCIHSGESPHTHTRVEDYPEMYTSPTSEAQAPQQLPDFYPVEWSEQKSDKGNAELLARYFGYDILFVPEAGNKGGYYVWTGTHWEHDKGNAAMYRMAKQITGILLVHASKQATTDEQEKWASYAISCGNAGNLKNMIELVRTHVRTVHKNQFNEQRMLFNLKEGTVDLTMGNIRPHDRDDLLTKCQNISWNPAAECKRWLQFLDEIFDGNQEIIDFVQRAIGYTITGMTVEELMFIGYGIGRNGKGKFVDTIIALLGDYARPAKFDMFCAKKGDEGKAHDVAELFGARFVPASEGEQSKRLAEAKLKNMVSGDPVEGEKKYQDSFTYYPEYKIWLFSNYKPRIVGQDEGIWDKVVFIPFKRYFKPEERDKKLLLKLKAELPGILQWAIRGCLAWQAQGLNIPECLKQATKAYRDEQNVLGHFVEDELIEHDKLKAPCGQMYEHYKCWAESNGEYQMTATEFKERMEQRYGEPKRSSAGKFWMSVGIKKLLSEEEKWMLQGQTIEEMESAIQ